MEEEQNEEQRTSVVEAEQEPVSAQEPQTVQEPTAEAQPDLEPKMTRGERAKAILREHFSAVNIAYMALFTALAFVVTFAEFPIFPAVPIANQLKLDFANVLFMFEGFIFGPVEAIISIGIKELLCLTKSSSGGAGELANFIMSTAYIIVPSIVYRFKKGRWWVCLYLVCACIVQIAVGFAANLYINFPVYGNLYGFDGVKAFWSIWPFVIYFNLIKSVSISIVVFIVYKPLARVIRLTADKIASKRKKAARVEEAAEDSQIKTDEAPPADKNP